MVAAEVAHVVELAKKELELEANMESLGSYAPDDYASYQSEKRILSAFIADTEIDNEAVPAIDEWHNEIQLVGEARKTLCNNARVVLEGKVKQAEDQLHSERASLERVIAALEDVKEAQEAAEAAEKISASLLEIKGLVEVIQDPKEMYSQLKEKITGSPDEIIEAGIKDLGQYYELVTLAGHGFSSFEDLANFTRASIRNVMTAGEELGRVFDTYTMAQNDYEIPIPA